MKKLKRLEKVLLMLVLVAMICSISTVNRASGDVNEIIDIHKVDSTPTPAPTATPTPTPSNINANTNTQLPKTGVNDTAMWVLIGASVIGAVYAYKKIKDYNV